MRLDLAKGIKRLPGKRLKNGWQLQAKTEPVNARVAALLGKLADFE
jgi:hypothetical protein